MLPELEHAPSRFLEVAVGDEALSIPYRTYFNEVIESDLSRLDDRETEVLHSIYSRHHDGFVRQRHLEPILGSTHPWIVPYVAPATNSNDAMRKTNDTIRFDLG